jgi:hypothetical protein
MHLATFSVRPGDRLLFFTDGLLEARDRAGHFFRLDEQTEVLRMPGLQRALDELLDRLYAHTRYILSDDIAVLLVEFAPAEPDPTTSDRISRAAPPSRNRGHHDPASRPDPRRDAPLRSGRDG